MRILGEPFTEEERMIVLQHARSLLGKPWGHQGRGPRRYDCIGLLWVSVGAVRELPPTPVDYGRHPYNKTLQTRLTQWLGPAVSRAPIPGDAISLKWTGEEHHVALVTDHPDRGLGVIHCYAGAPGEAKGRVVEHGMDSAWLRRIVEVYSP